MVCFGIDIYYNENCVLLQDTQELTASSINPGLASAGPTWYHIIQILDLTQYDNQKFQVTVVKF